MSDYIAKEQAVIEYIFANFPKAMIHRDQVQAGDIDTLLEQLFGEERSHAVLLEFGGGARKFVEPFSKKIWAWSILGVYWIRYLGSTAEAEADLREIVVKMANWFEEDHTLGGLTPWVRIERIDQPEVARINDIPFYWLPFEITIVEGP